MLVTEFVIGELNCRDSSSNPQKKTAVPRKRRPVDLRSRPRAKNRHELKVNRANKPMTGSAARVKEPSGSVGTCSCKANGVDQACQPRLTAMMSASYHFHFS